MKAGQHMVVVFMHRAHMPQHRGGNPCFAGPAGFRLLLCQAECTHPYPPWPFTGLGRDVLLGCV